MIHDNDNHMFFLRDANHAMELLAKQRLQKPDEVDYVANFAGVSRSEAVKLMRSPSTARIRAARAEQQDED